MLTKILIICLLLCGPVLHAEIDLIDAWTLAPGATTASAGTDRLLIMVVSYEASNASDIATADFGATAMTFGFKVSEVSGGIDNHIEVWYLLNTDIPSGSQSPAFAVTFTGNTPGGDGESFAYGLLDSVDQTSPINNTKADSSGSSQTLNVTVTTVAGGLSLFVVNQKTNGTATWTGPTEQWDQGTGDFAFSGADDLHSSGGTLNGSVTVTGSIGRMVIMGIEFEPVSGEPAEGGWQGQVIPITIQ